MTINKNDIQLIPFVARVLVEYERIYDKKTAQEMFDILVNDIIKKVVYLLNNRKK